MDINQAIRHYGSQSKLAQALGLDRQVIHQWKRKGEIPEPRQYQIQVVSGNALKADKSGNAV